MNQNSEIFTIISNYFFDEISPEEQEILNEWLKNPENKQVFKDFAKANYLYSQSLITRLKSYQAEQMSSPER